MSHDAPHPHLRGGGEPQAPDLGPRAHWRGDGEAPGFWDKKANADWLFRVLYAVSAVLVVADFFVHRHHEHPWEELTAFYPLYGFVGIVLLVLVAKVLRRVVMRGEDYYDHE